MAWDLRNERAKSRSSKRWSFDLVQNNQVAPMASLNRRRVFLMTKLDGRNAKSATMQLDESLKRLQADHIDLIQFHAVIRVRLRLCTERKEHRRSREIGSTRIRLSRRGLNSNE
jgi:diketogulonate reductase-like aldo/keto reductase